MRIRTSTTVRRIRYGPNNPAIRRRFARRTAGSSGRSGGASSADDLKYIPMSCHGRAGGYAHVVRRVCVFCGASSGRRALYAEAARAFGHAVGERGVGLVYGGGRVGLMGSVADGALAAGAEVIGVIPKTLVERELAHSGVGDLRVVGSLHERKALMAELSDAFA